MTVVLSVIFTVRSAFNLLFFWGLIPRFYPEEFANPVFWDALFQMLFEFLPIKITLLIQMKYSQSKHFIINIIK